MVHFRVGETGMGTFLIKLNTIISEGVLSWEENNISISNLSFEFVLRKDLFSHLFINGVLLLPMLQSACSCNHCNIMSYEKTLVR